MKWLALQKILEIHERSILESGGDPGVRDLGLLESAVAQPRARFAGKDLYPNVADKAAALAFSLVRNHPFTDGNKRTGYAAMMMFLSRNGFTIRASIDERERIIVSLAAGALEREEFVAWVRDRVVRKGVSKPTRRPRPPGGAGTPGAES